MEVLMKKLLSIILVMFICFSTYSQVMFVANLTGSQETPPVSTSASGTGWFVLNADSSSITIRVTYARLQGTFTASHIHVGALGVAGPTVVPMLFNGNTIAVTWKNVPDSLIAKLLSEDLYFNVHSSAFPGGEIRGQIRRVNGIGFTASMLGSQEVPPVVTPAEGTAYAIIANNGTEIKYAATIAGLSAPLSAAHFHIGAFGVAGPVVNPVTFNDSTVSGTWTMFPDSVFTALLKNRIYINAHTSLNPNGEIRGQFFRQGEIMFKISMDANQEVPPTMSPAKATGWAVFSKNINDLNYSITYAKLTAPLTAAHFHHGAPGVPGNVVIPISFTGNQIVFKQTSIPDSVTRMLIRGEVYANIHTSTYPGGEIRGQLQLINGVGFTAVLNGLEEVPPNNSPAVGTGWLIYGVPESEADTAKYEFTVANLTSPLAAAHFHNAPRFVAGPVVEAIPFTDSTVSSTTLINDLAMVVELFRNRMYANVHTSNFPDGEIRGQLFFAGVQSGSVNDVKDEYIGLPDGFSLSQNYPNPFNPSTKIKYSVPSDGVVKLKIFNLIGEEVAVLVNKEVKAGAYEVNWNAAAQSSGIYFYKLETVQYSSVKKMILIK